MAVPYRRTVAGYSTRTRCLAIDLGTSPTAGRPMAPMRPCSPRSAPMVAVVEDAELAALISVDSTSIRAHQHAAGARAADHTGGRCRITRICPASRLITPWAARVAGWTTKIHALIDAQLCPVDRDPDRRVRPATIRSSASLLTRHSRTGARGLPAAGRQGLLPRLHPQLPAATPIATHHPRALRPDRTPPGQGVTRRSPTGLRPDAT